MYSEDLFDPLLLPLFNLMYYLHIGQEFSRKRASDVAELRDDIVNTALGILGLDCSFKYHNAFAYYKRYTDIQNLILILEEHEVTVEINEVPEAIHNPYTCSTSSYRP